MVTPAATTAIATAAAAAAAAATAPLTAGADAPAAAPATACSATYEELMQRSVKELKALLSDRGVAFQDCVEKGDLARRVQERCSSVVYYK